MIIKDYLTNETKNIDIISDRESDINIRKVVDALVDMKDVHHIHSIRIRDTDVLAFVFVLTGENSHEYFGCDLRTLLSQQFGEWKFEISFIDNQEVWL